MTDPKAVRRRSGDPRTAQPRLQPRGPGQRCQALQRIPHGGFHRADTGCHPQPQGVPRIHGIHAVSRDTHLDHAALLTSVSGLPDNGHIIDLIT
jgi:hypothetical protein